VGPGQNLKGLQLTYDYEIFSTDASQQIGAISGVSSQADVTKWIVNNGDIVTGQYTWRARADYFGTKSTWTPLQTFFVQGSTKDEGVIKVYPNPVRVSDVQRITFLCPKTPSRLTITTVSGKFIIRRENISGEWVWDGKNEKRWNGINRTYLWLVEIDGRRESGKLVDHKVGYFCSGLIFHFRSKSEEPKDK